MTFRRRTGELPMQCSGWNRAGHFESIFFYHSFRVMYEQGIFGLYMFASDGGNGICAMQSS
jgi:hypothetical protein